MKQRDKKQMLVFLLLVGMIVLLFSGCKGESSEEGGKTEAPGNKVGSGRFFEKEVNLPKEIRDIRAFRQLTDGSLCLIGAENGAKKYFILKSTSQGEKWEKKKIEDTGGEFIPQAAIAGDGKAALFHYAKDRKVRVEQIDAEGKNTPFTFELPGAEDNMVVQAAYDGEGNLIVLDMSGSFYNVDASGGCNKVFDTEGASIHYFSIAGTVLAAVHDGGVQLFDTRDKKRLETEAALDDFMKEKQKLQSLSTDTGQPVVFSGDGKENSLWFAMDGGVFYFTRGGSVVEQIVDGTKTTLSTGEGTLLDMAVINAENFFVAVNDGKKDMLLHYSYDDKAAAVPNKELTVYALDDSSYVRQAVKLFSKNNPDVSVNLEVGLSGKDGVTLEDALSTLNTNILAGKGPDVLILDGMPLDSYIEKGILADISDVVEEVDKKDGIFPGIKEGSKKDGKLFAMPVRFLFSVVEGDKEAVASGGTLSALAEQIKKVKDRDQTKHVLPQKGPRTLLRDLYYADSATWQKEDGTLDRDVLTQFLTDAKTIYDADQVKKDSDFREKEIGDGTFDGEKMGTNDSMGFLNHSQQLSFGSLSDVYGLQTMCSAQRESKTEYALLNGDKVKAYIPYLLAGVTEGGNKETAKAFVKELLGEKAQASESNGIPVNRTAYDKVCKEKMDAQNVKDESSVSFGTSGGDESFGFAYVNLTQEELDKFTGIVESLVKPSMTNRVIQELVLEQGSKFLLGEQELSQTVEAVLQKVNLYLTE